MFFLITLLSLTFFGLGREVLAGFTFFEDFAPAFLTAICELSFSLAGDFISSKTSFASLVLLIASRLSITINLPFFAFKLRAVFKEFWRIFLGSASFLLIPFGP